eukprot:CAMPEP_0197725662 /NCGR_PEP_ID=MMETSP1434-20131217/9103_1 /TAXON_ID=265543 /ORGANISM="Minutocellus polymorphus, Strain CCMP3303" /LENGTH=83 /DNA_ID=CAMNT_0043311247 /DNA_START=439 /DNA_END=690 /DNA_ORIENTATION=-
MDLACCNQLMKSFDWEREEMPIEQDDGQEVDEAGEAAEGLLETIDLIPSRRKFDAHRTGFRSADPDSLGELAFLLSARFLLPD